MQVTVVVTAAVVDSAIVLDVLNLKFTFLLEIFSWLMSLDLRSSWLRDVIYPVSGVHTSLAHQTSWGCFRHWRGAVSCWVQLELCAKSNCHEYFCAHGTHTRSSDVIKFTLHCRYCSKRRWLTFAILCYNLQLHARWLKAEIQPHSLHTPILYPSSNSSISVQGYWLCSEVLLIIFSYIRWKFCCSQSNVSYYGDWQYLSITH